MAKKELPKAQLGGLVKAYQGAKAGFKLASKIKTRAKNIKAIGIAKKEKATTDAAAEAAAKNSKTGTTKKSTTSTTTPTPQASKGKEPFVKSKGRLAFENVTGNVIGGAPFYTVNAVKKVLKNRIAQNILIGGTTAYAMNKIAEGRRPVKIKKIKKK